MAIYQMAILGDSMANDGFPTGSAQGDGRLGGWDELIAEQLANIPGLGPLLSSGFRGVANGIQSTREWSYSGSWTSVTGTDAFDKLPYGLGKYANGASNILTFTRPIYWRRPVGFALYWVNYGSGGNWQYRIDGGTWTNMGQTLGGATANKICKFYISTPVNATLDIRASSDATTGVGCFPAGIELFWSDPTVANVSGLIVHHLAVGAQNLHGLLGSTNGDRLAILDSVQLGTGSPIANTPNAGVLLMHINDVKDINNTTTWNTDLTTFNTRVSPLGPVGFINPYQATPATFGTQDTYRAQTKTTAAGFGTPAKVFDLFDAFTAYGFIFAGPASIQAASSGVQTASLVGAQSLTVGSTAGFPLGGEFSLTGLNGNDAKITYSGIDATHFNNCRLVTGSDIQLFIGDALTLLQNSALNTALLLGDGIHASQAGHIWIAERLYWFVRNQILGIITTPSTYAVKAVKATAAYKGAPSSAAYKSGPPIGVG